MKIKKKEIISYYNKFKRLSTKAFFLNQFDKSLEYISLSAKIAYNFNWIYSDNESEQLLQQISSKIIKKDNVEYIRKQESFVFYDFATLDNKGLTVQYLRAFIDKKIRFLYITESNRNDSSKTIFEEIDKFCNAQVYFVNRQSRPTVQAQHIYDNILEFGATKLFMHLEPWSVEAITAFYALPKTITKYQINLTDHAFWLGNECLDYSLEFRHWGCSLSTERRGLNMAQILLQPYYPVVVDTEFLGFPEECDSNKVIIFSGGAFYKIYGNDYEFFYIVKNILDENPSVIFLFAGTYGDKTPLEYFIKINSLEHRFILLGNRFDINEVFRHCDIYMNTYPIAGGLMIQYAAMNGKPILSYQDPLDCNYIAEELLNIPNNELNITFIEKRKFLDEVKKMVNNPKYRIDIGTLLKKYILSPQQFNDSLFSTISSNKSYFDIEYVNIEFEKLFDKYFNNGEQHYTTVIGVMKSLGFRTLYICPKFILFSLTYSKKILLAIRSKYLKKIN